MAKYIVTGPKVIFGAGIILGLTAEQLKSRKHCVKKSSKGYCTLENVEFKKDEVIDIFSKSMTKNTLANLEQLEKSATTDKKSKNDGEKQNDV